MPTDGHDDDPLVPERASPHPRRTTDLLAVLDGAVAALKTPLGRADTEQGWTDDLRREIQEEISVSRSALRRHGPGTVRHLRPRLDEWLAREGVRPGRLRDAVLEAQRLIAEARRTAGREDG
ncbi:hypothetical protein [Streptomyces sp. DH37]|uniref:hypothetical protein n=1 Tax=Streptomyces sp. DH37 TaxID=3040122 RepID=UPI002443046D|nr:hypothetical protein [Streptomyces sp. DH37]MDG9704070.1 hypothetical protein [Streptomyces sp. DH37]